MIQMPPQRLKQPQELPLGCFCPPQRREVTAKDFRRFKLAWIQCHGVSHHQAMATRRTTVTNIAVTKEPKGLMAAAPVV